MRLRWLNRYDLPSSLSLHFCSCNIFGCKSFFLRFCNQQMALHLKCKSHALKSVIHADRIIFRGTFCHLHLRQCCYTIIHECLYSAEFAQIVISDPKLKSVYVNCVIWCTKLYWVICVFFGWFITENNVKLITLIWFDLIWKLMRDAKCVILSTVSVCIMPPLLYETHVIEIRPQNWVVLSIEHCLLVWFMPRVVICLLGKRFILILFHAAVLNKNKSNSTIHACLFCSSLLNVITKVESF